MESPATSSSTPQQRVLGFVRVCLFLGLAVLLVGACNHELAPPPGTGSGAGGGGGTGAEGVGGQGGDTSCFTGDSCVSSCSESFSTGPASAYCDATGAFACAAGTVRLSTCPPNACVQFTPNCCDDTTGAYAPPPCGPDGLKQACPAGSHAYDSALGCIPTGLGVTSCLDLRDKPCTVERQSCTQGDVFCSCASTSGDGGALTWQCAILI